jgi:hypothetical protein
MYRAMRLSFPSPLEGEGQGEGYFIGTEIALIRPDGEEGDYA